MRFAVFVAGVCVALLPFAQTRAESPLGALLAAVRASGGTPYAYHLRATLSETIDGVPQQRVLEIDGQRRFLQQCQGIVCSGFYFDGRNSFETDSNQSALPTSPAPPFDVSLQAALLESFADPNFRAHGGSVRLLDSIEQHGGKHYRRIRVTPPLGPPVDVTLDPLTGHVVTVEDPGHRVSFQYPHDRQGLPALPSAIVWAGKDGPTQRFSDWNIEPKPLAAPAGLAPTFSSVPAVIKMLPAKNGSLLPIVACNIAGHTVPALLDTGDSNVAMSLELAEQLGIEPTGGAFAIRGIGQYVTGIAPGPGFSLGPVSFGAAKYTLLHDIHRLGYDLVLGADVFAQVLVAIDYAKREVDLAPATAEAQQPKAVALVFEDFVPVAHVWLGATPAALALDTGDEASVNLRGDFYAKNTDLFSPTGSIPVRGVGGTSTELTGTIPSITLDRFEVHHQPIGATQGLIATGDGHLGSGFLAHFIATFDYAHARVELEPRNDDAAVSESPQPSL